MLYKLPQILKVVVLYSYMFLAFGSLLEAFHPPAVQATTMAATSVAHVSSKKALGAPARLSIPRLGMDLPVIPGAYDPSTKTWTLTDTNVQFAGITSLPNETSGDTLLYGHNTSEVLAPTSGLVKGDIAKVTTTNGRTFTYAYMSDRLVDPTDTSVVTQTASHPQLTLLTCNGLWDTKRRLMIFDFVSVQ